MLQGHLTEWPWMRGALSQRTKWTRFLKDCTCKTIFFIFGEAFPWRGSSVFFITFFFQLGKMRMTIPTRASTCRHLQCFDCPTYLQMNERKPTWNCPVCDKPAEFDNLTIDGWEWFIAVRWMSFVLIDDKSTLVQLMAWCRQATSHYQSQCWPSFMSPYGVTRPQWVNSLVPGKFEWN